jgi:hypothetical protein
MIGSACELLAARTFARAKVRYIEISRLKKAARSMICYFPFQKIVT